MTNINICQCTWTLDVWPQGPVQQSVSWQAVLGHPRQWRFQDRTRRRIRVLCSVPVAGYVIWLLGVGCSTWQLVPSWLWAQLTPVPRVRPRHQHQGAAPSAPWLALGAGQARVGPLDAGGFHRGNQGCSEYPHSLRFTVQFAPKGISLSVLWT